MKSRALLGSPVNSSGCLISFCSSMFLKAFISLLKITLGSGGFAPPVCGGGGGSGAPLPPPPL
jgi:hypothetical protein